MAFSKSGVCSINDLFDFNILHGAILHQFLDPLGLVTPFYLLSFVYIWFLFYVPTIMSLTETLSVLFLSCLAFWGRSMAF